MGGSDLILDVVKVSSVSPLCVIGAGDSRLGCGGRDTTVPVVVHDLLLLLAFRVCSWAPAVPNIQL